MALGLRPHLGPLAGPSAMVMLAVVIATSVVWLAVARPWLGLSLALPTAPAAALIAALPPETPPETAPESAPETAPETATPNPAPGTSQGIPIVSVTGPLAEALPLGLPQRLTEGAQLMSIAAVAGAPFGRPLPLYPLDRIEEPDILPQRQDMARFRDRQARIDAMIAAGPVQLLLRDPLGNRHLVTVTPAPRRPLADLPAIFWLQLLVGVASFGVGAWVLAVAQGVLAARAFFAAAAGLMLAALSAAIYSTRELALPAPLLAGLGAINQAGALGAGLGMVCLFLLHPVALVAPGRLALPIALTLAWFVANQAGLLGSSALGYHLPVVLLLLAILGLVAIQAFATRGRPVERAALTWFGLTVALGSSAFIGTRLLPLILRSEAPVSQGAAFLFFLPIFLGVGLGVTRYRLFDLQDWTFRILFWMLAAAILLAIDAALLSALALGPGPALGMSLFIVGFLYLPLRERLRRWLLVRGTPEVEASFRAITEVALTPTGATQRARWGALLQAEFRPAGLAEIPPPEAPPRPRIIRDGTEMLLPAFDGLPGLRLVWHRGGQALFGPRDRDRAEALCELLAHSLANRRAYERGAAEERTRIARDMHDNIGLQLLGALHSPTSLRKDALIRDALADLRAIVASAGDQSIALDEAMAELRHELGGMLEDAGLALDWPLDDLPAAAGPRQIHALRSVLREAVSNTIRHAGARKLQVRLRATPEGLELDIRDDGRGLGPCGPAPAPLPESAMLGPLPAPIPTPPGRGQGLANIRARAQALDGRAEIGPGPKGLGTRIRLWLPHESPATAGAAIQDRPQTDSPPPPPPEEAA